MHLPHLLQRRRRLSLLPCCSGTSSSSRLGQGTHRQSAVHTSSWRSWRETIVTARTTENYNNFNENKARGRQSVFSLRCFDAPPSKKSVRASTRRSSRKSIQHHVCPHRDCAVVCAKVGVRSRCLGIFCLEQSVMECILRS